MSIYPDIIPTAIKMLTALGVVLGGMLVVYYFTKRYKAIINRITVMIWITRKRSFSISFLIGPGLKPFD